MSVAAKSYNLSAFGADRAKMLYDEGTISHVRCPLWPLEPAAVANFAEWPAFVAKGVPMWGWLNCSNYQDDDLIAMRRLDSVLAPAGWVLDIEGKWVEGAKLDTLIKGAKSLGKPLVASLAGYSASHVEYDYRRLDAAGISVEWQAYEDSGEGPDPATAVRELYESSFVIPGWEYRAKVGTRYGWGKFTEVRDVTWGILDFYRDPGTANYAFRVAEREWGYRLVDRELLKLGGTASDVVGRLLGRARYSKIRVALIVTEEIAGKRIPDEWTSYAASARMPGMARRPVAVYPVERCPDDVLRAIVGGAA